MIFKAVNNIKYNGTEYDIGATIVISEKEVFDVLLELEAVEIKEQKLSDLSRDELNDLATEMGIDDPDKYKNKKDLIDEIENSQDEKL